MNHALIERIKNSTGTISCQAIGDEKKTKIFRFSHIVTSPKASGTLPNIAEIQNFYTLVGSLTLYHCAESDEAAFYIAHPDEWDSLAEAFAPWAEILELDLEEEELPNWFGSYLVIGEMPKTANYLLLVTDTQEKGAIYKFDHDGAEFTKLGSNLQNFITYALNPKAGLDAISHMRFIKDLMGQQWWATELHHSNYETTKELPVP